ncbi:MAG: MGDG synthase family glycosyltransferase [Planctomycetota bacterium]|jgi:processive 1,2-diacylglycerol beta-glucosyltransferase
MFISASVGAGHNAAARAVMAELAARESAPDMSFVDDMTLVPRAFRAVYSRGFEVAVVRAPRLYGSGFRMTDRPSGPRRTLAERRRLALERRMLKRLRAELLASQPDLIVHTHFLAPPMVGRLIGSGELRSRQVVVITDCELHRFWYAENVDHWFVASESAARTLADYGVPDERVTVSGIPVHPKWTVEVDRQAVLAEWKLPADRKIVLLFGGAHYTTGPIARIARQIAASCRQAYVCVLTGRNEKLRREIDRLAGKQDRVRAIPMTDRLHELVSVCSLMIVKPGGISTAECVAKGTPMVLLKAVPGQESANARFYEGHGAAISTRRWADVVPAVRQLLTDDARLASMAESAGALYRPATTTIADAVLKALA